MASIGFAVPFTWTGHSQCLTDELLVNIISLLAVTTATALLFIRVGVVWRWDIRVTTVSVLLQATNFSLGIYGIVEFWLEEAARHPSFLLARGCSLPLGFNSDRFYAITVFGTDVVLLCMLFTGLRRWKYAGAFGLWQLLWNQGLVYLMLLIVIEVPFLTFLALNLNDVTSIAFSTPMALMLPIAATRFYRSLSSFADNRRTYESVDLPSLSGS
ncbi:unnamed protein product [Peniophora sp. CBMAI 1063]|nr:unnamed protein product [Peniophora sp. CBMAI 1063]